MNKVRNKKTVFMLTVLICFSVSSCDLFEMDINTDPNNPAQASLALLLTNVELNASDVFADDLNTAAMDFMAITASQSMDGFDMTNSTWTPEWNFLYSNPLKDLDGIIKATAQQREEGAPNPHYEGIAKTLKAYYFSLMVDLWGDVPYSQAFNGDASEQQLAPAFDDDQAIYDDLLVLLDEAIAHFDETSPVTVRGDVIYGGSASRWTTAAKSLKLRLLIQISKANPAVKTQIDALMLEGDLIDDPADDFVFTFGALNNPDDRHPMYRDGYAGGEADYTYFGHQFMYEMLLNNDPRTPFYFKRQTSTVLNPEDPTDKQTIPCSQRTDCKYSYFPLSNFVANGLYGVPASELTDAQKAYLAGFFGRDRADPSGIPNDTQLRTNVGVYPAGGLYDDEPEIGGGNQGQGSGIFPMITTWMVKLYQIEAILSLGSDGDARALFQAAMEEQITKVSTLGTSLDADAVPISEDDLNDYVADRLAEYDAAGDDNARLRVVLKQAWFMNFGNGYEIYNAFRRTGFPSDLQIPLQRPRQFALRLPYTLDEINLNSNTPEVVYDSPGSAVFWDVLKFQFN